MHSSLYISSPINAIVEGYYRDDITIDTLKTKGDFGIGTFNHLDGEMIALDGCFYQLDLHGETPQASRLGFRRRYQCLRPDGADTRPIVEGPFFADTVARRSRGPDRARSRSRRGRGRRSFGS
mgnify:CR=1 FL=1